MSGRDPGGHRLLRVLRDDELVLQHDELDWRAARTDGRSGPAQGRETGSPFPQEEIMIKSALTPLRPPPRCRSFRRGYSPSTVPSPAAQHPPPPPRPLPSASRSPQICPFSALFAPPPYHDFCALGSILHRRDVAGPAFVDGLLGLAVGRLGHLLAEVLLVFEVHVVVVVELPRVQEGLSMLSRPNFDKMRRAMFVFSRRISISSFFRTSSFSDRTLP